MSGPAVNAVKHLAKDFSGKVVFITGAGSGIGRATAHILAVRGASVAMIDIRAEVASEAAKQIEHDFGVKSVGIACDTSEHAQVREAVERTVSELGGLHCALNAAGLPAYIGKGTFMGDYDIEEWRKIMDVNANGVFYCVKEQLNHLVRTRTRGSIVNVSSIAGVRPLWLGSAYVAAKHAVIGITQSASLEYCRFGIRTNAIAPGFVDTPQLRAGGTETHAACVKTTPLGEIGKPEEIGELAAFLLSDKASYITGATHLIDGGWSTAGPGPLNREDAPKTL